MKRLLLIGVAALFLATGTAYARNSSWPLFGASSHLTCGQFNKLGKNEKEGALSWALGYASGTATQIIQSVKGQGYDASDVIEPRFNGLELITAIKRKCLKQPDKSFLSIVNQTYFQMWRED